MAPERPWQDAEAHLGWITVNTAAWGDELGPVEIPDLQFRAGRRRDDGMRAGRGDEVGAAGVECGV
jgi:hypothetical protein